MTSLAARSVSLARRNAGALWLLAATTVANDVFVSRWLRRILVAAGLRYAEYRDRAQRERYLGLIAGVAAQCFRALAPQPVRRLEPSGAWPLAPCTARHVMYIT